MKTPALLIAIGMLTAIYITGCDKKNTTSITPPSTAPVVTSVPGSIYTSKMGGIRVWHGIAEGSSITHTSGNFTDTISADTFAVTIVNDTTVQIRGYTINLHSFDSVAQTVIFLSISNSISSTLTYYYVADRMDYQEWVHILASSQTNTYLNTP